MRALRLHQPGRLSLDDIAEPIPYPGQVIVQIAAITLNHLDIYGYQGMRFAKRDFPIIVGGEGVGRVVALGEGVRSFQPGDRVAIYPGVVCHSCPACRAGRENLCENPSGARGFHVNGLGADKVAVAAEELIAIPDNLDWYSAACAPVTFAAVEQMLIENARLTSGETVLIHAGASGIGSAALSLAKSVGAYTMTTVSSYKKAAALTPLAPDHIINYAVRRFDRDVLRLTRRRGVDVVFEHVGADTWEGSLMAVKKGGRVVICGSTSGTMASTNLLMLFNKQITIYASFGSSIGHVKRALLRLANKQVKPLITQVIALEEWEDSLHTLRKRQIAGKIVIDMKRILDTGSGQQAAGS